MKVEPTSVSVLSELKTIQKHHTQLDTFNSEINVKLLGFGDVLALARKNEAALATLQKDVQALHSVVNEH